MFQKIFCRVFLWSHNFLLQVSRLLVSPGQSRAYHVCQQWNVLQFYNKILYSKRHIIFSNEIRVFNSIYTHLFHLFIFVWYLFNQHSAFPLHYHTSYYFINVFTQQIYCAKDLRKPPILHTNIWHCNFLINHTL